MTFQLIFNSLVAGLMLSLVAVGFNLVYSVTKVFHFAHGAVYVSGAYSLYWLHSLGLPFWLCIPLTVVLVAILAAMHEWLVYLPLYKNKSAEPITLISSLGIYLLLINIIALLFTNEAKVLDHGLGNSFILGDLVIAPIQVIQLVVGTLVIGGFLWHSRTKGFLPVKAVISESTVASVIGVNLRHIRLYALIVGSILTIPASVSMLFDSGISPHSGMTINLTAAVAAIIGGAGSFTGTVAAAFLITFLATMAEWTFSGEWREFVTFALLIIVLMTRTEGLVSMKIRIEEK